MLMELIDEHGVRFVILIAIPILIEETLMDGWFRAFELALYGISVFILTYPEVLMLKKVVKVRRGEVRSWIDYRYPSMHTAVGTALGLLPLFFNVWLGWSAFLIPLGIYNRIKLGRHTWIEVIGGMFAGMMMLFVVLIAIKIL